MIWQACHQVGDLRNDSRERERERERRSDSGISVAVFALKSSAMDSTVSNSVWNSQCGSFIWRSCRFSPDFFKSELIRRFEFEAICEERSLNYS